MLLQPPEFGPFVRHEILTRLRQATALAREDLASGRQELRDLVSGVLERIDAAELSTAAGTTDAAQPASRLAYATLCAARGAPVAEFRLIPIGEIAVERPVAGEGFVFTRAHAEAAKRWFDQLGRKLAVDYEHQSFDRCNTRQDGLRPAAGWIGRLEVRDDGLWAVDVTWTERATELLQTGEYKYFSPVIFWTDEDHTDVAALGPVALTNDPAMRGVQALAARRDLDDPEDEAAALRRELDTAHSEVTTLRRQLAAQEADTFVERGLRLGKILESTSLDWREDYLRDAEAAEARLSRAPVLLPPGRVLTLDRRGIVTRLPKRAPDGAAPSSPAAIEAEDLAAYEQACAAGRVVHATR
jgi:hypothetical protein